QDGAHRARAVYRAATSSFDGGSYSACGRLLADRTLVSADSSAATRDGWPKAAHVDALGGLAEMGLGNWDEARTRVAHALAAPGSDDSTRSRIAALDGFVAKGPGLPRRSSTLAGTFSAVIPGSGQVYSGRVSDGLRHFLFNTVMILATISFARGEHVPA